MKVKERLFLLIMIVLFLLSAGMFYYHNIYTTNQLNKNKTHALVATKDINIGSSLNSNNMEWVELDKDILKEENMISEDDIKSLKVSEKIFKGELISKNRLKQSDEQVSSFNTYTINLDPDFSSEISNGDLIRVYVQKVDKDGVIENELVFEKKETLEVISENEGTVVRNSNRNIKIEVTDKEAISYYNAKQMGSIIVLKYKDVTSESDYSLPLIDIVNKSNSENQSDTE